MSADRVLAQPTDGVEHAEVRQKLTGVLVGPLCERAKTRRRWNPELRTTGKSNAGGMTPTTSIERTGDSTSSWTRIIAPMIRGFAPKRCLHSWSLITAVRGSFSASSWLLSGRPIVGGIPTTSKNDGDTATYAKRARESPSTSERDQLTELNTPSASTDLALRRQVSTSS